MFLFFGSIANIGDVLKSKRSMIENERMFGREAILKPIEVCYQWNHLHHCDGSKSTAGRTGALVRIQKIQETWCQGTHLYDYSGHCPSAFFSWRERSPQGVVFQAESV